MGYMRHHAILVSGGDFGDWPMEKIREQALQIFPGDQVSPVQNAPTNSYQSFAIFPDGSKEGWEESDQGDKRRAEFIAWLRVIEEDSCAEWVEVQYADDEGETKVCDCDDWDERGQPPQFDYVPEPEPAKPEPEGPAIRMTVQGGWRTKPGGENA